MSPFSPDSEPPPDGSPVLGDFIDSLTAMAFLRRFTALAGTALVVHWRPRWAGQAGKQPNGGISPCIECKHLNAVCMGMHGVRYTRERLREMMM